MIWFHQIKLFLFIPFHRPTARSNRLNLPVDYQSEIWLRSSDFWVGFLGRKRLGRETYRIARILKGSWNQKLFDLECPSRILLENRIYTGHKLSFISRQLFLIKSNNNHYPAWYTPSPQAQKFGPWSYEPSRLISVYWTVQSALMDKI